MQIPERERPAASPPLIRTGAASILAVRELPRAATVGSSALVGLLLGLALLAVAVTWLPGRSSAVGIRVERNGITETATAKSLTDNKRPNEKATDFSVNTPMYITYTARSVKRG